MVMDHGVYPGNGIIIARLAEAGYRIVGGKDER